MAVHGLRCSFNAAQSSSASSVLNSHRNNSAAAGTAASGSSTKSASAPSEVERLTEEIGESYKLAMQMASNGEFDKLEAVMNKMICKAKNLLPLMLIACSQAITIAISYLT